MDCGRQVQAKDIFEVIDETADEACRVNFESRVCSGKQCPRVCASCLHRLEKYDVDLSIKSGC
jgi:hypothetical protein